MKQLGLVLLPLAIGAVLAPIAWTLFHTGWAVTLAVVLPIALLPRILRKVRALNQEEYLRRKELHAHRNEKF